MKIRGFLLALCVLVCLALTIQADCVQKVTHISEAEIPEVERSLNARILKISTKQAELILAEMRVRDPESKNILFSPFRALQIAQRESVTYNALTELMDSALICHEFRNQSDVLVRFQANIRLAAKGDKDAADQLCKLFGDDSLSTLGKNAGTVPGCLGVLGGISRIRWLTHTGRQVPPSGLKPNSRISTGDPLPKILTRGLPPHPPAPLSPSQSPGGQGGAKRFL
jgi:hypothetical protein